MHKGPNLHVPFLAALLLLVLAIRRASPRPCSWPDQPWQWHKGTPCQPPAGATRSRPQAGLRVVWQGWTASLSWNCSMRVTLTRADGMSSSIWPDCATGVRVAATVWRCSPRIVGQMMAKSGSSLPPPPGRSLLCKTASQYCHSIFNSYCSS